MGELKMPAFTADIAGRPTIILSARDYVAWKRILAAIEEVLEGNPDPQDGIH